MWWMQRSTSPVIGQLAADGRAELASDPLASCGVAGLLASSSVWLSRRGDRSAVQTSHPSQKSKTDQQISFRSRWSSKTSSRTASGSCSRCQRHSSRPALSPSRPAAAARTALMA
jgi:hypothetical protein